MMTKKDMSTKFKAALIGIVVAVLSVVTYAVTTYGPRLVDKWIGGPDTLVQGDSAENRDPFIEWIDPSHGPVQTTVKIFGRNFLTDTLSGKFPGAVIFHTASAEIAFIKGGEITAVVPKEATTGHVVVRTLDGRESRSTDEFVVRPARPVVHTFKPDSGPPGTEVTIYGMNFDSVNPGNNAVLFSGALAAPITFATFSEIRATVPQGAGTGRITVKTSGGEATSPEDFVVISGPVVWSWGKSLPMLAALRAAIGFPFARQQIQRGSVGLVYAVRRLSSNTYQFTVSLRSSEPTLSMIDSVTYYLHPTFRPSVVTVRSRPDRFSLTLTAWGEFTIGAVVHFTDGRVERLSQYLSFQGQVVPVSRIYDVGLANSASLLYTQGDLRWYRFTLHVEASQEVLSGILYVEYHLHRETFDPPDRIGSDPAQNFAISWSGWGVFTATADVYFKDGTAKSISHVLSIGER